MISVFLYFSGSFRAAKAQIVDSLSMFSNILSFDKSNSPHHDQQVKLCFALQREKGTFSQSFTTTRRQPKGPSKRSKIAAILKFSKSKRCLLPGKCRTSRAASCGILLRGQSSSVRAAALLWQKTGQKGTQDKVQSLLERWLRAVAVTRDHLQEIATTHMKDKWLNRDSANESKTVHAFGFVTFGIGDNKPVQGLASSTKRMPT